MSTPTLFLDGKVVLHQGDCLAVLRTLASNSIDAIVSDPPYGIAFMGRGWDTAGPDQRAFSAAFWREALRVLKPGGHLLAFSANRTSHRMTCAIEDAGFEIRDLIWEAVASDAAVIAFMATLDDAQRAAFVRICENSTFGGMMGWVFGSGFPKSMDLSKAIDKAAGAEREVVGSKLGLPGYHLHGHDGGEALGAGLSSSTYETRLASSQITAPATPEAIRWAGFGTALKPALEPITLARKPLDGTIVANVLKHGVGALNIDGCRVEAGDGDDRSRPPRTANEILGGGRGTNLTASEHNALGRFPANLILDGSDEVAAGFPDARSAGVYGNERNVSTGMFGRRTGGATFADSGSASRFFYNAKADALDRLNSKHPTIKPLDLMQYLVRLVTPPGGLVLDPFAGTGTTGEAAWREGLRAVLIERETAHCADIARRMELATAPISRRTATVKAAKAGAAAERGRLAGKAAPVSDILSLF